MERLKILFAALVLLVSPLAQAELGFPQVVFDSGGTTTYTAATGEFVVEATPLAVLLADSDTPIPIFAGTFYISVTLDPMQQPVSGALEVTGTVDLGGLGMYAGILMTGSPTAFSATDSGTTTDFYSLEFVPTGGQLNFALGDSNIGVNVTSEQSDFIGDFHVDFSGEAKGTLGTGVPGDCPDDDDDSSDDGSSDDDDSSSDGASDDYSSSDDDDSSDNGSSDDDESSDDGSSDDDDSSGDGVSDDDSSSDDDDDSSDNGSSDDDDSSGDGASDDDSSDDDSSDDDSSDDDDCPPPDPDPCDDDSSDDDDSSSADDDDGSSDDDSSDDDSSDDDSSGHGVHSGQLSNGSTGAADMMANPAERLGLPVLAGRDSDDDSSSDDGSSDDDDSSDDDSSDDDVGECPDDDSSDDGSSDDDSSSDDGSSDMDDDTSSDDNSSDDDSSDDHAPTVATSG